MAPLAGPSVGTESFGRGENIGVVVEIPLAIVATLRIGQALDDSDDSDYSDNSTLQLVNYISNYSQRRALGIQPL